MKIDLPLIKLRQIKGYEGLYYISKDGNVFSQRSNKYLSPSVSTNYYKLILSVNNKRKTKMIHRLAAEAFIENPLCKREVNHIDGNKLNNNVKNLEWCTTLENEIHADKNNLRQCPLTDDNIREIRKSKKTQKVLGIQYSVSGMTISRIKRRTRRAYVND